jgi:hypothetical protein
MDDKLIELTKRLVNEFCLIPTKYVNKVMFDDITKILLVIYNNTVEMKTGNTYKKINFMEPFDTLENIFYEKIYDSDSVEIVNDNQIEEIVEYIEKFFIDEFNMSFTLE